jgi:hypothetical protein
VGGAKRRPLIFRFIFPSARRAEPRLAAGQKEVRPKDFFGGNLFLKKIAIPGDFFQLIV